MSSSQFGRAWPRLLLTAALGMASAATAQTQVPQVADVCAVTEDLADVQVNGLSRGTYSLRRAADTLWIQRNVLQDGEDRYGGSQVTCDGLTFTQLNSALAAQYDEEQQVLSFQSHPELLPVYTVTVTVAAATPAAYQNLPVSTLEYGLEVHRLPSGTLNHSASVQGSYANGPLSVTAGLVERGSNQQTPAVSPSASVRYQVTQDAHLEAGWNIQSVLNRAGGTFSGVQGQAAGIVPRFTDEFSVDLPLPGSVVLTSGGVFLGRWTFGAGRAVFRHLPLNGSAGSIIALISDARGQREQSTAYEFPAALLPAGSYRVAGEAGQLNQQLHGGAQLSYGLSPNVTVDAQAQVTAGVPSGLINATTASLNHSLTVGLTHNVGLPGSAATVAYGTQLSDTAGLGIKAQIPLARPQDLQAEATLGYGLGGISTAVGVGYDAQQAGFYGRVQASGALTRDLQLSGAARISRQNRQLSLTLGYQPNNQWSSAVNTVTSSSGTSVRATTTYMPSPDQRLNLTYGAGGGYGSYQRTGPVDLQVGAGTTGQVDLSVEGAVAYANDRLYASAARGNNVSVLLETGVANLPIYASGVFQGRTDARGELVFSIPSSQTVTVRVDVQTLPIELSVKAADLQLTSPASSAIKIDWRDNFQQSRFVNFQTPTGEDAAYGSVQLDGGDQYDLDAFGTGLIPRAAQILQGVLRLQDGSECTVKVAPEDTLVHCVSGASADVATQP